MSYSRNSRKREEKKVDYNDVLLHGKVKWQNTFETNINIKYHIFIMEYKYNLYLLKVREEVIVEAHDIGVWYHDILYKGIESFNS